MNKKKIVWIFQTKPENYKNIENLLIKKDSLYWTVMSKYKNIIEPGDLVYLSIAKGNINDSGIYAEGVVAEHSHEEHDTSDKYSTIVKIEKRLGSDYISKKNIQSDDILKNISYVTFGQGSNFKIDNIDEIKRLNQLFIKALKKD